MDTLQYKALRKAMKAFSSKIRIKDAKSFIDTREGTLLWGRTDYDDEFHVYIKGGLLHRIVYSSREDLIIDHIQGKSLDAEDLLPDSRVYPEATSMDFLMAMLKAGFVPPLTKYNHKRKAAQWYGKTLEDMSEDSQQFYISKTQYFRTL